jgi:hypothetical protein
MKFSRRNSIIAVATALTTGVLAFGVNLAIGAPQWPEIAPNDLNLQLSPKFSTIQVTDMILVGRDDSNLPEGSIDVEGRMRVNGAGLFNSDVYVDNDLFVNGNVEAALIEADDNVYSSRNVIAEESVISEGAMLARDDFSVRGRSTFNLQTEMFGNDRGVNAPNDYGLKVHGDTVLNTVRAESIGNIYTMERTRNYAPIGALRVGSYTIQCPGNDIALSSWYVVDLDGDDNIRIFEQEMDDQGTRFNFTFEGTPTVNFHQRCWDLDLDAALF